MPMWQQIKQALTRDGAGYPADGRRLGLGLAAALEAQRRGTDTAVADIERYANDNRRGEETTRVV